MSSPEHTRKVVLSPRARQDFIDILRYTGETWGKAQLQVYRDKLNEAIQLIARNPGTGRASTELPDSHRLYFVGSHVIVFRHQEATIGIVRVLHQRMSISCHV